MLDEKSHKTTERCDGSQVPFPTVLKNFFTLSRKCQTEFSYTDAYYRSRKFKFHERNLIKEFITYTLFFKKCNEGTTMQNTEEEEVVINITEKMIQESKKYNCEVHFNVIWVYYFTYSDEEIKSLPVFKIHKGMGNGAVYVDAFSNVYQTWNCYIEGPILGESLLCVPRNGEYCFDGDQLNLEFVLTRNVKLECSSNSSSWVKFVAPLSQGLENWLMEVKSWLSKHSVIHSIVKKFMTPFKEYHEEIISLAQALLLAYFGCDVHCRTAQFVLLCCQAIKIIFIVYNHIQANSKDCNRFSTEIVKTLGGNWGNYPEAQELIQHFNRPSKNWIEIMDTFCSLIKKIRARCT